MRFLMAPPGGVTCWASSWPSGNRPVEFWVGQGQSLPVYYAMDSGEQGLDAEDARAEQVT